MPRAALYLVVVPAVVFVFTLSVSANQFPEDKDCKTSKTQIELNACWSQLAKEIEDKVKTRYSEVARALEQAGEKDALKILRRAHRFWERYRDAQCEGARQSYEGGSVAMTVEATCRAMVGRNRIGDLDATYGDRLQ